MAQPLGLAVVLLVNTFLILEPRDGRLELELEPRLELELELELLDGLAHPDLEDELDDLDEDDLDDDDLEDELERPHPAFSDPMTRHSSKK